MKFMSKQKITVLTTSMISPLFQHIRDFGALSTPLGDPGALCFELFLPWIYKLMLAYPVCEKGKDVPRSIPSRMSPRFYTKKVN